MLPLRFGVVCSSMTPEGLYFVERASTKVVDRYYRHRETRRQSVGGVECENLFWSPGAQVDHQCETILSLSLPCPGKTAIIGKRIVKSSFVIYFLRKIRWWIDAEGNLKPISHMYWDKECRFQDE